MHFEDFEVWKSARKLTNAIYKATNEKEFAKDYGLKDQIRRAAVSVMSNIAEGYEREGNQEFIQFLSIAKASCGEVRCQLYVAGDQGYMQRQYVTSVIEECKRISIMISNLIKHLKNSNYKGSKYKAPKQKSTKEIIDEIVNKSKEKKN